MLVESALTEPVIGRAIEVHRHLGPGLFESVYEECLCFELSQAGIPFDRQVGIPIAYKGVRLKTAFRIDILVAGELMVEIKSVATLLPIHEAQILTYLRLGACSLGLLLNFNALRLKDGLRRFVRSSNDAARAATA